MQQDTSQGLRAKMRQLVDHMVATGEAREFGFSHYTNRKGGINRFAPVIDLCEGVVIHPHRAWRVKVGDIREVVFRKTLRGTVYAVPAHPETDFDEFREFSFAAALQYDARNNRYFFRDHVTGAILIASEQEKWQKADKMHNLVKNQIELALSALPASTCFLAYPAFGWGANLFMTREIVFDLKEHEKKAALAKAAEVEKATGRIRISGIPGDADGVVVFANYLLGIPKVMEDGQEPILTTKYIQSVFRKALVALQQADTVKIGNAKLDKVDFQAKLVEAKEAMLGLIERGVTRVSEFIPNAEVNTASNGNGHLTAEDEEIIICQKCDTSKVVKKTDYRANRAVCPDCGDTIQFLLEIGELNSNDGILKDEEMAALVENGIETVSQLAALSPEELKKQFQWKIARCRELITAAKAACEN